jgi:hypothetical protein
MFRSDVLVMMSKPHDEFVTRKIYNGRTPEELIALLSAVASAILVALFIAALYFGREIFVPIALAILLSFVLAPLVGLLQRARIPRAFAVVSVVVLAFKDLQEPRRPQHGAPHMRGRAAVEAEAFFRLLEMPADDVGEILKVDLGIGIE